MAHSAVHSAALLTLAGTLSLQAPAHAGLFDDDEARKAILELRVRVADMRKELDGKLQTQQSVLEQLAQQQTALRDAQAAEAARVNRSLLELATRIDALAKQVASQQGSAEKIAFDLGEIAKRQRDIASGTEERLKRIEPVRVLLDGEEFNAEPAEKAQYDRALNALSQGDNAAASVALQELLRRWPQTGYRASAAFWQGNLAYLAKDYRAAMGLFRTVVTNYPKNGKAPEAQLALANCQTELKDLAGAKKTLFDLVRLYPDSEAAATARDRLSRMR